MLRDPVVNVSRTWVKIGVPLCPITESSKEGTEPVGEELFLLQGDGATNSKLNDIMKEAAGVTPPTVRSGFDLPILTARSYHHASSSPLKEESLEDEGSANRR